MAGMATGEAVSVESPMVPAAEFDPQVVLHRALAGEVTSLHEAALSRLPGAYEVLTQVATSAFNDQIRAEAISALGDLGDARTLEFVSQLLVKAMRLEVEWTSSQAVVEALVEFAPNLAPRICPALVEAFARGSFVAESARQGLVQYGAAAEPTLLAFLEDPDADPSGMKDVVDILGLVG